MFPKSIVATDSLTRFLFSDRDFRLSKMLVKERAFRPRDHEADTSVFRTTGQDDEAIWQVGKQTVLPERQATDNKAKIHGRADFNGAAPVSLGLTLAFDEPPPEHVLVGGWPTEKHTRMQVALELAARAFLRLPPTPIG